MRRADALGRDRLEHLVQGLIGTDDLTVAIDDRDADRRAIEDRAELRFGHGQHLEHAALFELGRELLGVAAGALQVPQVALAHRAPDQERIPSPTMTASARSICAKNKVRRSDSRRTARMRSTSPPTAR